MSKIVSKRTRQTYIFDYKPFNLDRHLSSYTKNSKSNPLLQKKDPSLCTHYRPISLIIEPLVHESVSTSLTEQNTLYEKKIGFRNNCSTKHALTELTEKIRQACDSGHFV